MLSKVSPRWLVNFKAGEIATVQGQNPTARCVVDQDAHREERMDMGYAEDFPSPT